MAENGDGKDDKFDAFTREGEAVGYISLEQARVLAMRHARDNTDFYGPAYSRTNLVWEVISQEDGEDYYDIRLSFRPAGRFRGEPGVEQFIIDKIGNIEIRQILDEPTGLGRPAGRRPRLLLPSAVGLVIVAVVAVAAVFASGVLGGDGEKPSPITVPPATATPARAPTATARAVAAPATTPRVAATPVPAPTRAQTGPSISTGAPRIPETVRLDGLKALLFQEIGRVAPRLSAEQVDALVSEVLAEAQATGKTQFSQVEVAGFIERTVDRLQGETAGPAPTEAPVVVRPPRTVRPAVTAAPVAPPPEPLLSVAIPWASGPSILPRDRSLEGLIQLRPMFEYLLGIDRFTGEVIPMLAEKWESTDENRRWTFHLRRGVQFHFGWGELTARDVAHSVQMLAQASSRAEFVPFWREVVKEIQVIDDLTVSFVLARPTPDLMRLVSSEGNLMILSKAQWDTEGQAGMERRPAGTGPYRFVDRRAGDFIKLQRVADHWRRVPEFEELVIAFRAEGAIRAAMLMTGEADITALSRALLDRAAAEGFEIVSSQLPGVDVAVNAKTVREYVFPGNVKGALSHLEYVQAAR
jgi:ABC-type transport system substrate-binding protein